MGYVALRVQCIMLGQKMTMAVQKHTLVAPRDNLKRGDIIILCHLEYLNADSVQGQQTTIGVLEKKIKNPAINWNILRKVKAGKVNSGSCRLCHKEKLSIAIYKCGAELQNERIEIMAKYRHVRKFKVIRTWVKL